MPPVSQAQARFLGAVAGGKARKGTGLSAAKAQEMLRGTKLKGLPKRIKKGKARGKRSSS